MGPSQTTVAVGETNIGALTAEGVPHEVVEVVTSTDASGVVTFTTPNMAATVRKGAGAVFASVSDAKFNAFVIEITGGADIGKYLVGIYHPTLGMRIQPTSPAATVSEVFDMCWQPGTISIQNSGVAQVGARCAIQVERVTADGNFTHDLGALKYHNLAADGDDFVKAGTFDGEWKTDASGFLKHNVPGQSLADLWFPRYPGNTWGTNLEGEMVWDGSDAAAEYADSMTLYYVGLARTIGEGSSVTVNVEFATMHLDGEADAKVLAELEGAGDAGSNTLRTATLNASGNATLSGVTPGRYACWQYRDDTPGDVDHTEVAPRQWFTIGHGEESTCTLGGHAPPVADRRCYAYKYGAEPYEGTLWIIGDAGTSFPTWTAFAATDSAGLWDGEYPPNPPPAGWTYGISDADGYQQWIASTANTYQFCVGGQALLPSAGYASGLIQGTPWQAWWADTDGDENLPSPAVKGAYVGETNAATELRRYFTYDAYGNFYSGPLPRSDSFDETRYDWTIYLPDGSVHKPLGPLPDDTYDFGKSPITIGVIGPVFAGQALGAKVNGELAHEFESTQIGSGNTLYGAGRIGLERGGWQPNTYHKFLIPAQDPDADDQQVAAYLGHICPYQECWGPVWRWPSTSGLTYGYCQNCADAFSNAIAMDARTHYWSPTVATNEATSIICHWGPDAFAIASRSLANYYPPVNYRETNGWLVQEGRGMATVSFRWMSSDDTQPAPEHHPILGTYDAEVFAQDETALSIGVENNITGAMYLRPKAVVRAGETHTGTATYLVSFGSPASSTVTASFTIPGGRMGRDGLDDFEEVEFLNDRLVIDADEGSTPWSNLLLISECTDIGVSSGVTNQKIDIVADVPAFVGTSIPLTNLKRTPVAFVSGAFKAGGAFNEGGGRVDMFRHPAGNVPWTVWLDGDDIKIAETASATPTLASAVTIDTSGSYDSVGGTTDGGTMYVDARDATTFDIYRWLSVDHGVNWTGPTKLT